MNNIRLDDGDVVSSSTADFGLGNTFKVSELKLQIQALFKEGTEDGLIAAYRCSWFDEEGAEEFEILRQEGGGWQKGRVRFQLEFIPDQPQ
ncbi:KGK domain-containing protein [Halotia branconii]|uniref:KGK domain-containing protein n=1 Tax=Halotia branconii CENA392 TaxID=1539056 RepID=A0AAJ6NS24_9CYAN|nr:KGK domain-containing protein [Halotia branconii]WGV25678.1 KGK domain-containing protein [Halotia branconii CENA392]